MAGCITKTATNPLKWIKMLSQIDGSKNSSVIFLGLLLYCWLILQNEGRVVGLWAGHGANLLRFFPAKAIVFATNNDMFQGTFWSVADMEDAGQRDE